jgi:radical SAM superfamily enzyme YgiQ (UPF0313 family)
MDLNVIPFGLMSIASSLRNAGYRPMVVNLNLEPIQILKNYLSNPDLLYIGFSVFTGPMIKDVLELSRKIRQVSPRVSLVWGGPHPTIMPELTAAHSLVDVVCRGEGEQSAVALAKAYSEHTDLKGIPGITFKRDGEIISTEKSVQDDRGGATFAMDLGSIDLKPYIFRNRGKKCAVFISSRGCPFRCSFCWNVSFLNRKYRGWKVETVQQELQPLLSGGVEKILLLDSFVGPISRVRALGQFFQNQGIEWAIEDGCRVDLHGNEEFFQTVVGTGCTHITFGAESGSQRILDMMQKDITVEDILRSATARKSFPLGARYQWMVGVPGETESDVMLTVKLIDQICRINPLSGHSMDVYAPYPGNPMYNMTCEAGWHPPKDLQAWGQFRWEGEYPHHQGRTWFYKSVFYSNFFYRYKTLAKYSAYTSKAQRLFRLIRVLLHPFAAFRWTTRTFRFPLEYRLAEKMRVYFELISAWIRRKEN